MYAGKSETTFLWQTVITTLAFIALSFNNAISKQNTRFLCYILFDYDICFCFRKCVKCIAILNRLWNKLLNPCNLYFKELLCGRRASLLEKNLGDETGELGGGRRGQSRQHGLELRREVRGYPFHHLVHNWQNLKKTKKTVKLTLKINNLAKIKEIVGYVCKIKVICSLSLEVTASWNIWDLALGTKN